MSITIHIRPASVNDAESIADIYNHYIRHTIITFEEEAVTGDQIAGRIDHLTRLGLPWIVAQGTSQLAASQQQTPSATGTDTATAGGDAAPLLGYAYAGIFRERASYRKTVETAIYLHPQAVRQGVGTTLYQHLFDRLKEKQLHRAVAGISLPNEPSVRLHEQLGFRYVGTFTEVGRKFDRWVDVGFWEKRLVDG